MQEGTENPDKSESQRSQLEARPQDPRSQQKSRKRLRLPTTSANTRPKIAIVTGTLLHIASVGTIGLELYILRHIDGAGKGNRSDQSHLML